MIKYLHIPYCSYTGSVQCHRGSRESIESKTKGKYSHQRITYNHDQTLTCLTASTQGLFPATTGAVRVLRARLRANIITKVQYMVNHLHA